ncbi:MAG: hypothetical protein QM723_39720 [Myxococcaceae bacterium]
MKRSELFEVVEPPPYGWSRMSARLSERRQPVWQPALGALFAVAIVVLGTLTSRLPVQPVNLLPIALADPASAATLGIDLPQEPVAVVGGNAAVIRLPSSNPQVVIYRLSSLGDEWLTESR